MLIRKISGFFVDLSEVVVFAIAIFLFIYLLVLQPHKIKGSSMVPNFTDGEYLLTDKLSYRFGKPQRGDVIVFLAPGTQNEEFIKRIIGLPGEKVSLNEGKVYINDKLLDEGYIPRTVITFGGSFLKDQNSVIVPNDSYFVLGDNRRASSDSRSWGFVAKSKINGKAWIVYWPPKKAGLIDKAAFSL